MVVARIFGFLAIGFALALSACVANGSDAPTGVPGATSTSTPGQDSTSVGVASAYRPNGLPGNLLGVSPPPGAKVGLDLHACAFFDVTGADQGGWNGSSVSFEIAGRDVKPSIIVTGEDGAATELHECATLNRALAAEPLEQSPQLPPDPGPLDLQVSFTGPDGVAHDYSWTVSFDLTNTPEAPAEVQQIRRAYRRVESVDEGRRGHELRIGGYFLHDDALDVYLLAGADPEEVRSEVVTALGDAMPAGGVRMVQLSLPEGQSAYQWISDVSEVINNIPDLPLHGMSGGCCNIWDRVSVRVGTTYAEHRIREALQDTDVPQAAVMIQVSGPLSPREPTTGVRNIGTDIRFDQNVQRGEPVKFTVTWTNLGNSLIEFTYSPVVPVTVSVFTPDGEFVWASNNGGLIPLLGASANLGPGEQMAFTYYWNVVDIDGFQVPPGDYVLQAWSDIGSTSQTYPFTIDGARS